jgi:hypothetical protein
LDLKTLVTLLKKADFRPTLLHYSGLEYHFLSIIFFKSANVTIRQVAEGKA